MLYCTVCLGLMALASVGFMYITHKLGVPFVLGFCHALNNILQYQICMHALRHKLLQTCLFSAKMALYLLIVES